MSYKISFTIDGDAKGGIKAVDDLLKRMEALGATKGPEKLNEVLSRVRGTIGDTVNAVKTLKTEVSTLASHKGFQDLKSSMVQTRAAALSTARAVRTMAQAFRTMNPAALRSAAQSTRAQNAALQQAAMNAARLTTAQMKAQTATHQAALAAHRLSAAQNRAAAGAGAAAAGASRWAIALRVVEGEMTRIARAGAALTVLGGRGILSGGMAINRIGVQGAGPVQSLGISTRMSGIAMGNLLSNAGSGGALGIAKMIPGVLATVAELGVRVSTAMAGFVVKGVGLLAQGVINFAGDTILPALGGLFGSIGGAIGKGLGLAVKGVGAMLTGITNLVGEAVTQIGNVFTGLAEIARGAFQGVLNIASEVFAKVGEMAGAIVSKVLGVVGMVGKTALGAAAVVGGFAFADFAASSKGIAKVNVLLETKVTPEQRKDLRLWIENLKREIGGLTPQTVTDTLERAVSTGFQADLPGAKRLATAALRLSAAGQAPEEAPTAARVMAKSYVLFKEEFDKAAGPGGDPFEVIADNIQALVNYGDLKLPDIVNRLGEILAKGQAVGASFQDLVVLLAQMSQALGPEQTFTNVGHLLTDPLKFGPKALELLKSKGVNLKTPNATEAARLANLAARLAQAQSIAGGSGPGAKAAARDVKELTKELADAERAVMGIQNPVKVLSDIFKAGFAPGEMAVIFRNIRGLVGALAQMKMDPAIAQQIERGVRVGSAGSAREGATTAQDNIPARLAKFWSALKGPFEATFEAIESRLTSFFDWAIAGFQRLGDWWRAALEAPSALAFIDNLKAKLSGLFGSAPDTLFGGLFNQQGEAQGIDAFWGAMSDGLDTVWEVSGRVITAFSTLYEWIAKIIDVSGAGGVFSSIGGAMGQAFGWLGQTAGQLGEGKTSNLDAAVEGAVAIWDGIWAKGRELWDYAWAQGELWLGKARALWDEVWATGDRWLTSLGSVVKELAVIAGALAAVRIGGFLGGGGGIGGGGGGGRGGGGSLGGGMLKGLGRLLSVLMVVGAVHEGKGIADDIMGTSGWREWKAGRSGAPSMGESAAGLMGSNVFAPPSVLPIGTSSSFESAAKQERAVESQEDAADALKRAAEKQEDAAMEYKRAYDAAYKAGMGRIGPSTITPLGTLPSPSVVAGMISPGPSRPESASSLYYRARVDMEERIAGWRAMGGGGGGADPARYYSGRDVSKTSPLLSQGYHYDTRMGVFRKRETTPGTPFGIGNVGGTVGGTTYTASSWAKKIARAERDPGFEGGVFERFTSRGRAASERTGGGGDAAAAGAADALSNLDPGKVADNEAKLAGALKKIGEVLPQIVEQQGENADEILTTVSEALEQAKTNDGKHTEWIQRLQDQIAGLREAAVAAGELGQADGST